MENIDINIHKELIEKCKLGSHAAFKDLYVLYAKSMYNVALRILRDPIVTEDILQDAFLKTFHKINQFDYQATFGAWLKKIVVNQSLDYLRKESKWIVDDLENQSIVEEEGIDWEDVDLRVEKVREAILNLPSGFRTVASLYLFEGYEHKEIAEMLDISENTSKSQFHRAKKKIKNFIKDYETGQTKAIY